MNIDWFTFTAQIVNFLILVLLLRRFLYGPIVHAMEEREEKIAARNRQAEQCQQDCEAQIRQSEQQRSEFNEQREELMQDARRETDEERKKLISAARTEVQSKRNEWYQALDREREELLSELQSNAGQLAVQAARRTLSQLADESLEERMFAVFTSRLQKLDDEQRRKIHDVLGDGHVFVRSAFDVSEEWRDRLRAAMHEEFGYSGDFDFETAPNLTCGLELEAGGYAFGWNVDEFLRNIAADFDGQLRAATSRRI